MKDVRAVTAPENKQAMIDSFAEKAHEPKRRCNTE